MKYPVNKLLCKFFLILLISVSSIAVSAQEPYPLFGFSAKDTVCIKSKDGYAKLIDSDGQKRLSVINGTEAQTPGIVIYEPQNSPWNLDDYYMVQAEVSNVSSEEFQVEMFVGNDPDGLIRWYCSDYVDLKPGETKTITVYLSWTPWVFDPQPKMPGMRGAPGIIKTPRNKIDRVSFNVRYATKAYEFTINKFHAINKTEVRDTTSFFPFVDKYGQFKHDDWERKIHNPEEMKASIETEAKDLEAHPEAPEINEYGGWTKGPKYEKTGYFYPRKVERKWWLVDPEGYLFWTAGVNCVSSNASTGVQFRESFFEELADENTQEDFYSISSWATHGFYKDKTPYRTYNFHKRNLHEKYGSTMMDDFRRVTHQRLRSWGLNTIGFVSDPELTQQRKTPYVGSVWIRNTPKIEASKGFWGKFHDVFDPRFRKEVRLSVKKQKLGANDPWCIGYFVDNEMSWGKSGSLSISTLESPASQPAKKEFVSDLKTKYGLIEKLNSQWKMDYESWDDLLQSTVAPEKENALEDLLVFYDKIARTYFKIVSEELKKVAPNQNYLGCRFAWNNNDITLRAAADYCDIISFNKYEYSVENVSLPEGVDKPIMIGEFHFGALDRGMFHLGVKAATDQNDRGLKYQSYIKSALDHPNIVGAHWFQYVDQPLTGRGDGENYNVGLIDVCDQPYYELISKMRETLYEKYEYRMKGEK
ncbi:MAG: beta-galactosidase [Cyclobacteriaceae bacterium]